MKGHLLLSLLLAWCLLPPPTSGCDTGVAHVDSVLSVPRSLMANADVAYLTTYNATGVERCMEDCCTGKYGACTVASFKKNVTENNCIHFYCQPLRKCMFLSSKATDSFSFSSTSSHSAATPSNHPSSSTAPSSSGTATTSSPKTTPGLVSTAREDVAPFSEAQFALKSDNTSIKPRKGVVEKDPALDKNSVKPRKGVIEGDDDPVQKSNVKPRKGVGPGPLNIAPTPTPPDSASNHHKENITSKDLMETLEKVFGEDQRETLKDSSTSVVASTPSATSPPPLTSSEPSSTPQHRDTALPSLASDTIAILSSISDASPSGAYSTPPMMESSTSVSTPEAFTTSTIVSSSTTYFLTVAKTTRPPLLQVGPKGSPEDGAGRPEATTTGKVSEQEEKERRYTSSIHLVLSLVFGLLVLFAVLGVVARRVYDSWVRRDYYRMNYLIDGIYNGVE